MTKICAGIDFGTSNSSVALAGDDHGLRFVSFPAQGEAVPESSSYRSLLFFDPEEQEGPRIEYEAGSEAIAAYLDAYGEGRLIQSFKTHLTSTGLGRTRIARFSLDLEEMIALYFRRLRRHAERAWGHAPEAAVLGRPVHFVGAETEEDDLRAQERLKRAAIAAGFSQVYFELEPLAAAYHYEARLERDELALIADFGGGTTDFCVVRLGPGHREEDQRSGDVVATGGVGIAGDDLDAAIIRNVVAPALGRGSYYNEMGNRHQIPGSFYNKLARWHQLSFLRGKKTHEALLRLRRLAEEPEKIAALAELIDTNQGFHLHKSVERCKVELSRQPRSEFTFRAGALTIRREVKRESFEAWISECTEAIADCLDRTLTSAGVQASDVATVFMTGGTAFVPAVRRIFEARFGGERLRSGDELISIAGGLARRAASF